MFEHIYCDKDGFSGEQNAAQVMGWTNSQLFCDLASSRYGILTPLPIRHTLPVERVSARFRADYGVSVEEAANADDPRLDEMLFAETRQHLLQPFLASSQLILYDWSVARLGGALPVTIQQAVKDVLEAQIRAVPLARDVFAELPSHLEQLFHQLQTFEREPLRHLRSGRLGQPDYLKLLSTNIRQHREIDLHLADGLPLRLDRILTLRDRFGRRGGWKAVRELLAGFDRVAPVPELLDLKRSLDEKLDYCFKPLASEFLPEIVKVTRALVRLEPTVHNVEVAADVAQEVPSLTRLFSELLSYFRGDHRSGRRSG